MLGWLLNLGFAGGAATVTITPFQAQLDADISIFYGTGVPAAQLAIDLAHVVGTDMSFGTAVTYGASTLNGIFNDHSIEGSEVEGPSLLIASDDLHDLSITHGDTLTILGRTFVVSHGGIVQGGRGTTRLVLEEL